ncbi:MAG: helix-turn-helix domain-containing protein [Clostridia bacterium]
MKTIKEEISSNLLFYRKRANLTQKELATYLGIKHNSISA